MKFTQAVRKDLYLVSTSVCVYMYLCSTDDGLEPGPAQSVDREGWNGDWDV